MRGPANQGRAPAQQQQQEELPNDGKTTSRDIKVRDDKTILENVTETELTPEQTVERYETVVKHARQLGESISTMKDKMAEVVDEFEEELGILHTILDDEPQEHLEKLEDEEKLVDSISAQDIQRLHSLREMKKRVEQMSDNLENCIDDAGILYPAAKKMSDRHGFSVDTSVEELVEEIEEIER